MTRWRAVCQEPFRILFPLGALFGCMGAGHWFWYALGIHSHYSGFYHASVQMGAYLMCFVAGFLLTALPRFMAAAPARGGEVAAVLGLFALQIVALWMSWWAAAEACFAGLLIVLAVFALRRLLGKRIPSAPPVEFVWIPAAVLFGLIGEILLILAQNQVFAAKWLVLGRLLAQQGSLLAVVLGIGGFMLPRLMGRRVQMVPSFGDTAPKARKMRKRRLMLHLAAIAALAASFCLEGWGWARPGHFLRAAVVTLLLWWTTRVHRPPEVKNLYVRWLWVSVWMIIAGFWAAAFWPDYRVAMLHLVFLGGFSLMSFQVGTMVVLSHTGEAQRVREPLWIFHWIGWGISAAITARLSADFLPGHYFRLVGTSAACWLVVSAGWLAFILPRVLRPQAEGAFERAHEEAKQRLRR